MAITLYGRRVGYPRFTVSCVQVQYVSYIVHIPDTVYKIQRFLATYEQISVALSLRFRQNHNPYHTLTKDVPARALALKTVLSPRVLIDTSLPNNGSKISTRAIVQM